MDMTKIPSAPTHLNLGNSQIKQTPGEEKPLAMKQPTEEEKPLSMKLHNKLLEFINSSNLQVFVGNGYDMGAFTIKGEERGQILFEVEGNTVRLLISNYVGTTPSPKPPSRPPVLEEVEQSEEKGSCFSCANTETGAKETSKKIKPSTDVTCQAIIRRLFDINNAAHGNNNWFKKDDTFDEIYDALCTGHGHRESSDPRDETVSNETSSNVSSKSTSLEEIIPI